MAVKFKENVYFPIRLKCPDIIFVGHKNQTAVSCVKDSMGIKLYEQERSLGIILPESTQANKESGLGKLHKFSPVS